MMSPANAIPAPDTRPMLRRTSPRERWPRMIAGIPARIPKHRIDRMPKTKLAVAFPSVGGGCPQTAPGYCVGGYCPWGGYWPWTGGAFKKVEDGGGGGAACGASGTGAFATGVAHCGQTWASSGMEAPQRKQNILYPHFCDFGGGNVLHLRGKGKLVVSS